MAKLDLNGSVAWTQQSVNNAANGRLHIGAVLPAASGVTGLTGWRSGVVCSTNQGGSSNIPNDLQIKALTPTPSLTLTCEAGHAVITRTGAGPYLCALASQGQFTLADADPALPRIDRIVARLYDTALGDSMPTTPALASPGGMVIQSVTGTPSSSPTVPALPHADAITIAHVAVAAGATQITNANITDMRRSALTPSGARTQLGGDLAVTDNGAVTGELRHTVGTAYPNTRVWDNGQWRPLSIPVYANTTARNTDLTSSGQYSGQLAISAGVLAGSNGSAWFDALPVWGVPELQIQQSGAQSIANNTFTTLAFGAENTTDVYSNHDNVTNNSRFTVSIPGVYQISGGVSFVSNATGQRGSQWMKNGSAIIGSQTMFDTTTGGGFTCDFPVRTMDVAMAAGDYFEMQVYQNSGGALNTSFSGGSVCIANFKWVRGI